MGLELTVTSLHLEAHILSSMLAGRRVAADGGSKGGRLMTLALDGKLINRFLLPFPGPGGVQLEIGSNKDYSPQGTGRMMQVRLCSFSETPSSRRNGVVPN